MSSPDWRALEDDPAFQALVRARRRFTVPATVFFVVYYFALPVLVGYVPDVMGTKIFGNVNVAYLFALSQFFMAWLLMWLYVRRARAFDRMAEDLLKKAQS
jgi:uncharacterized membrane protein (DUF485 family)